MFFLIRPDGENTMHYMHPARSKPLKIPNLRQASSLSSPVCLVLETHLAVELQVLLDNQTRKEFSQMSLMRYSVCSSSLKCLHANDALRIIASTPRGRKTRPLVELHGCSLRRRRRLYRCQRSWTYARSFRWKQAWRNQRRERKECGRCFLRIGR